jgi:hypothetical protein
MTADATPSPTPTTNTAAAEPATGRRNLLRLAGAAAAGSAVVVMRSTPAAAVDGANLINGNLAGASRTTGIASGNAADVAGSLLTSTAFSPVLRLSNTARPDSMGLRVTANNTGIEVQGNVVGVNAFSDGTGIRVQGTDLGLDAFSEDGGDGGHFFGSTGVRTIGSGSAATAASPYAGGGGVVAGGKYAYIAAASTKAHILLTTSNVPTLGAGTPKTVPPTRTDAHERGEIDTDASGDLWYCVAGGTPGTWRKLSGAATAGTFHAITPTRVYDSRRPDPAPGTLSSGSSRTIGVKDGRNIDTGAVDPTKLNIVPAGATAIACNITAVNTAGASGFLTVNPGGVTTVSAASVNWSGTQVVNNGIVAAINPANLQVTVVCGGTGASCNFVLDVTGFWR